MQKQKRRKDQVDPQSTSICQAHKAGLRAAIEGKVAKVPPNYHGLAAFAWMHGWRSGLLHQHVKIGS